MIEITEAVPFAQQADGLLKNKIVTECLVMQSPHKFCWINKEPEEFRNILLGKKIKSCTNSAHYIRILFESDFEIAIGEDIRATYHSKKTVSSKNQLVLVFEDGDYLELKTGLYGFIMLGKKEELMESQPYYKSAFESVFPLSLNFTFEYFLEKTQIDRKVGSVKQALSTSQHIPGVGNGVLQDVLFAAKLRPMKKVNSLTPKQTLNLYHALCEKIKEMIDAGGRDSMNDLSGVPGHYESIMTSKRNDCPICGTSIKKMAYLGGKVIYCPHCQVE